jgi:hypothetical protein
MNRTSPFCCPRCKTAVGYIQNGKLHVEINERTFVLDGFIKITCPLPCNGQFKYRAENANPIPDDARAGNCINAIKD